MSLQLNAKPYRITLLTTLVLSLLPLPLRAQAPTEQPPTQYQFPSLPRPPSGPVVEEEPLAEVAPDGSPLPAVESDPFALLDLPVTAPAPLVSATLLNQQITTTISVAEMGQNQGLLLSGGQLESGIMFTLPADQVITHAQLRLALKVSPALAERNNSLQLVLNGQPLGSLTLHQDNNIDNLYQLEVPAAMIVASNNLSFVITGEGELQCEKGASDNYWVNILPTTQLQMEAQVLNVGRDLGQFPRPFFDPMQMKETRVNVAFSSSLTPDEVSAAAMVTSYFGMESDYRNISFPVLIDALPDQNGIVFAKPGERIGDFTVPAIDGPQIQIIDNPLNPVYKLVLVLGRDAAELRQAAYRLISGPMPKQTDIFAVQATSIPQRKPYDAPRWIPTDRPVYLRDLVPGIDSLTVSGVYHDGIRIPFRAAPDLFMWDGDSIPIQIGYRFPTESWIDENSSLLNVSINGTFLRNLSVNKTGLIENTWRLLGGDTRQENYRLQLPPYLIYGDNQLDFYFSIKPKVDTPCKLLTNNNIKSRIDPESYIDLSNSHHFSQLPNLSFYVGASFPFSRLADFSQTLLLLPETPSAAEISTLLNLTARAGKSTGVPVNNLNLRFGLPAKAAQGVLFANKDILVVSSQQHKEFYERLLIDTPFAFSNNVMSVVSESLLGRLQSYLSGDWLRQNVDAERYLGSTGDWRGFLSFRSLWDPQRVVVVATATSDQELVKIHTDLQLPKINAGIRGDLAVITDENGVRSFRVSGQFPSGEMPWYLMVMWYASQHIIVLSLATLLIATLIGWGAYTLLRRHAAQRLGYDPEDDK